MKIKAWGPFRVFYGRTRWDQKTICFGGGKGYTYTRGEWYYFIGVCLYAFYFNVGIKKGWYRK